MSRYTLAVAASTAGGIVLAFVIVFLVVSAGPDPADQTEQLSPEQLYLAEVMPQMSPDRSRDTIGVVSSGQNGVCGVWADPSSPATRVMGIELLMTASGYGLTEATAIYEAAVEFLCPEK